MGAEATLKAAAEHHKVVTSVALASGEVQQLSDGRAAFLDQLDAAAVDDTVALRTSGIVAFKSASAVTFSKGDQVWWDKTNNTAVTLANAAAGDWYLGRAHKAKANGDTTVEVDLNALAESNARGEGKLYVNVAASAAVTNTTTETAFDKSYTIPASELKAGDVIHVKAQVIATSTNGTDTLTVKLKIGSTVIVATAAVDVADNDIAYIDATLIVRTVGASGTLVAFGLQGLGVEGTVTAKPFKLASTAIDTTASQAITVTATWSVANAGNSCRLDALTVDRQSDRVVL